MYSYDDGVSTFEGKSILQLSDQSSLTHDDIIVYRKVDSEDHVQDLRNFRPTSVP